jgi:hypothetical protein
MSHISRILPCAIPSVFVGIATREVASIFYNGVGQPEAFARLAIYLCLFLAMLVIIATDRKESK